MILKNLFEEYGYRDILIEPGTFRTQYFFDLTAQGERLKPEELVSIYISRYGDELILVLNHAQWGLDTSALCKKWDRKLEEFCNFGCNSMECLHKFMYNMLQVILFTTDINDRSEEASLRTSRKVLLSCSLDHDGQICVSDSDAMELPFYLGKMEAAHDTSELSKALSIYLPNKNEDCYKILTTKHRHPKRKPNVQEQPKTFTDNEHEAIKGWLTKL